MTTENVEIKDRNINQLLALNTYQDMTDSEIETIINYKVNLLVKEELNSEHIKRETENANKKLDILRQSCEKSESMLKSILNRGVQLSGVEASNG
jgi:hypothetical protein